MARVLSMPQEAQGKLPAGVRWGAIVFLWAWLAAYWRTWGIANFLHLCDVAVILTCIGLWRSSALLLSSQAVSSLMVDLCWALDAAWRWLAGRHLMGGTEYLFDPSYALWVRLLSLFHVALPFLLLGALRLTGYDRRALPLQCSIALTVMLASRLADPAQNINFAFRDPFFHRAWGSAPAHMALMLVVLIGAVYWPTDFALRSFYSEPKGRSS